MFSIFKAIKVARQMKKGTFDAREFAGDEAGDLATGILDIPIVILGALTLLLLVFGFTPLWFGPVEILGFFGILFGILFFIVFKIKKFLKRKIGEQIRSRNNPSGNP